MRIRYDSDMAIDLKEETDFTKDYDYYEEKGNDYHLEVIQLNKDDYNYNKSKGLYISLQFEDITDDSRFIVVQNKLKDLLISLANKATNHKKEKVLICGLGNNDLACDRLGPLLKNKVKITHMGSHYLLIPGVKGQTGIETFDLISSYSKLIKPDLIIIIDALATKEIKRLNKVIQLTDTGIRPGSGIGNHCLELSKKTLQIPTICIGVPTVVRIVNILKDVLNVEELNFDIDDELLNKVVMDKSCDLQIQQTSKLIAYALNDFINEN